MPPPLWAWPVDRLIAFSLSQCVCSHRKCSFDLQAEAVVGQRYSVATEMMLRLLQLEHAADTIVGQQMFLKLCCCSDSQ